MSNSKKIRVKRISPDTPTNILLPDESGIFCVPFSACELLQKDAKSRGRMHVQLRAMQLCAEYPFKPEIFPELAFSNAKRTQRCERRIALCKLMQALLYKTCFRNFSVGKPNLENGFIPVSQKELLLMTGLTQISFCRAWADLKRAKYLISNQKITLGNGEERKLKDSKSTTGYALTDKVITGIIDALCRYDLNFKLQIKRHLPGQLEISDRNQARHNKVSYQEWLDKAYSKLKSSIKKIFDTIKATAPTAPNPYITRFAADLAAKFKISSDQSLEILRRLSGSLWSALMKTPDHIPIDKALIQLLSS